MTMLIGYTNDGSQLTIDPADLTTHGVVLGKTGSGKTGATVAIIEEAVLSGASAIVIDPKGDLTNLALAFPNLTSEEFTPWMEDGKDPVEAAERARDELGHLAPNVKRWKDSAEVTIYAPGKTQGGGQAVNVLASFDRPVGDHSEQALRDRAASLVASILSAIGHTADPMTDPANVLLTDVVVDAWQTQTPAGLETWAAVLNNPPAKFQTIDGLKLDDFFPKKRRMQIARSIVGFRRQAAKWLDGGPLSVDRYVGSDKPKVSVFTLRHLDENERQFFAAMLLSSIVDYMFRMPASNKLKLLVVIDEARGYLPPYPKNPPTKKPICTLLAQGRAQGIGMLIGTQNPNDMDYKALTNVGTWFLGNLRPRDCARDLKKELENRNVDQATLSAIPQRHFLVLKRAGDHAVTKIRWAYSYLRGPLNSDELLKLSGSVGGQTHDIASTGLTYAWFKEGSFAGKGDLELTFVLRNSDSRPVTVSIDYSLDGGRSWKVCALRGVAQRYATSPDGLRHRLTWTTSDLGRNKVKGLVRLVVDGRTLNNSASFTVVITGAKRGFFSLFG